MSARFSNNLAQQWATVNRTNRQLPSLEWFCLSSLSNTLCDVATALDLAAEVTAGEENEDPGNDESWLAQATTVRDFVFQDLPSTLVEVVAKARGGNSKHMWPPETAIESCSNTCRKKTHEDDAARFHSQELHPYGRQQSSRNSEFRELRWYHIRAFLHTHPSLAKLEVLPKETRPAFFKVPSDENDLFWLRHIPRMVNLTHLDLFQLGTDEVLQSVGATCPKLVYLKFQLRIQVNNTGHYERICVTEKGILALLNCQELKTITSDQSVWWSRVGDFQIELAFRKLILGLPKLEDFNIGGRMGGILNCDQNSDDDKITTTNLRVFREFKAEEEHIKVMERFCPNVRELYLTCDYHRKMTNEHKFMHRLAMSKKINSIKSLYMTGISLEAADARNPEGQLFADGLELFLKLKGGNLHTIKVTNKVASIVRFGYQQPAYSTESLRKLITNVAIGCPGLKELSIVAHVPDLRIEWSLPEDELKPRPFEKLQTFHLDTVLFDPNKTLKDILAQARNLDELCLRLGYPDGSEGPAYLYFEDLLSVNPLDKLRRLTVDSCRMEPAATQAVMDSCRSLRCFRFDPPGRDPPGSNEAFVARKREEINQVREIISERFPGCLNQLEHTSQRIYRQIKNLSQLTE